MRAVRSLVLVGLVAGLLTVDASPSGAVTLTARGSLGQVQVWGATPGATLELLDALDQVVTTGAADAQGAFIFGVAPEAADDIAPGTYTVQQGSDESSEVTVFAFDHDDPVHPDPSFYAEQVLPAPAYENKVSLTAADDDGFGYVTTRDGTQLSINVMAPFDPLGTIDPPYPTLINYSGYTPAFPGDNAPETVLARAAGFAVVGVNMRGTGCSGGAYSYFEPLQALDGYDVIEAVAAQPWVRRAPAGVAGFDSGPDVGMLGISFPGISQLFVARTKPPSLAAISPLSVLADSYRSTLYPGGILNNGFATGWVNDRENQAAPAGQQWAADRIGAGDTTCEGNQRLKLQAPPLVARFTQDLLYTPDPGDALAPEQWVDEIEVPTFIAGAFQDEQTGGRWATMLDQFDPAVLKRAILFNGTHADALGPDVLRDLLEFLDLYVARRGAQPKQALRWGAPEQLAGTFGEPYALGPYHGNAFGIPSAGYATQTGYEAQDPIRVYWERGGPGQPECFVDTGGSIASEVRRACDEDEARGAPFARFTTTADSWPLPGTTADEWYLQPDGGLGDAAPTVPDDEPRGWSSWAYDNSRDQVGNTPADSVQIWHKDAPYDWEQPSEPTSLRYVSAPVDTTHLYAGSGSVDLWLRSTAEDVDVEVTLTEVRDDGSEAYIQSGWLRASHRLEDPGSTPLAPSHAHLVEQPLVADQFAALRVELFPFTHVLRPGSRLAVTIAAPGGNRPFWHFDTLDAPGAVNDIGHSLGHASRLNLPEVPVALPAAAADAPACGHLRAMPCRDVADSTRPTGVVATIDAGGPGRDLVRGIDVAWTAPEAPGVTSNDLEQLPGGQVLSDDAAPGYRLAVAPDEAPPAGDAAFRITATFPSGDGEPSDASLSAIPAHPFSDVGRDEWNVDAVDWVSAWNIVSGFTDGTFRNNVKATRGQVVSWLWSTFGRPTEGSSAAFVDTAGTVGDAARWARGNGIAGGFPGNRFRPGRPVTRAQAVAWLWAAAGEPAATTAGGYADVAPTAWYGPALDWAKEAGIVTGFAGTTFRPGSSVSRGQVANWLLGTARDLQAP